jgi:small subunit ribosomal protein S6
VLLVAEGKPALVKEVERRIRVTDGVVKFMTVRVDEELRKAEGRKARRAKWEASRKGRAAAKPAPAEGEGVQA